MNKPSKAKCLFYPFWEFYWLKRPLSRTAKEILSIVQAAIVKYGATKVTTVGHSLGAFILELFILLILLKIYYRLTGLIGAAIALLDVMYFPLHISGVSFRMIGYGMPRVCVMFRQSHSISTYIFHSCFRWEIERLQNMLTPISMSHTSITSQ